MSYDELFNNLRQKLDVLGYHQPLPLAAVPLAGALFEDLVKTTESLRDAKLQLSNLLEEKSCWELGVEPYKCDNSRLLAECNALHLELIKQRDSFDEQICDYARKIRNLESDKRCLEDHCIELESQIRDLNLRYTDSKTSKNKKDGVNMSKKPFITTVRTGNLLPSPLVEQPHPTKCTKCNSILWARQPGGGNSTDIEKLQNDIRDKADQAALYKKKVDERDREIRRLNDLLTGGRPPPALAKDCCYKNVGTLSEDVEKLQKEKVENCLMIRELQESMHEAKQRAVDLAERNKKLERELKEIKDAALSVEQQANEEISKKESEISQLCDEIRKLKRQRADSNERRPDRSSDEKRRLNERLNEMIHREKELEADIDRMAAKNCKLKSKVLALQKENEEKRHREDKSVSTEVDEERIRLKSERDLFQKEYLRLVEKSGSSQEVCLLRAQLKEKEDELKNVRSELCHLRSQTARSSSHDKLTPPSTSISVQAAIIRAEREREIARAELDRVKAERDILREKLQYSTDAQLTETDRFKREIQELNSRICQLQAENRDLLSSQVPGQTHIILLKEEMEELKKRLCEVQNENCQLNTRHNQLKLLHEQTERALVDYQNKHAISEANLRNAESRLACLTSNRDTTRSDICSLQNEISVLKSANANLEGEKDKILNDLDKKTEKLYRAENEMKLLKTKKEELEFTVQSLETRLDKVTSERRVRESELHETSTESKTLRQQISTLKEIRDQTIAENGRLSNELADAKADHSLTKKKLKESEKEVDRLKQQLQSYVQKVQRAEDLLMQKECEREEMLDHYRTLSHDAIALEGNNQSLEMEAAQHKRQLLEAEQEIARLKQEICIKDRTIEKLEKQVSCLSAQICRLEKDLEQAYDDQKLLKIDLDAIKELCEKLDLQSEKQNAELQERGEIISKLEKENLELRKGSPTSTKGKATADILQDLLAKSRQELEEERKALCKLAQEKLDLRKTIEEMQKNLETEREKASQKEALAKEYSVQIQEMQHNLTDDRFQKARSREESPRNQNPKVFNESKTSTSRLRSGCCKCSCASNEAQNCFRRKCCACRSNVCQNSSNKGSSVTYISSGTKACYCKNPCCTCPKSKSKTNSLKSMKSTLKSVNPCKRESLLEDVKDFLGGKSCKYEETISFDDDSDDIIVRRKRCVETKRFKGCKGDKRLSETFGRKEKSSSRKSGHCSDGKSNISLISCQCKSDSRTKERTKSSYTPGISVKVEPKITSSSKPHRKDQSTDCIPNSSIYSKDPQIESICRDICSETSDSKTTLKYSQDPEIDSICRKLCAMSPTDAPLLKEKMRIKPYVRPKSQCACESVIFNPFWSEALILDKKLRSSSKTRKDVEDIEAGHTNVNDKKEIEKCIQVCKLKPGSKDSKRRSRSIDSKTPASTKISPSQSESKKSIKGTDTQYKEETDKCMRECKLKFGVNDSSKAESSIDGVKRDSSASASAKRESNSTKSKKSIEDTDTKYKEEIDKCMRECNFNFCSNDSKVESSIDGVKGYSNSLVSTKTPPTSSRSKKSVKYTDIKYKEEIEKCIRECKLKYGSKDTKYTSQTDVKKDKRSPSSSSSSKMITDVRTENESINERLPSPSKTRNDKEDTSIEDINTKIIKKIEKCIRECKLKFGSNGSKDSRSLDGAKRDSNSSPSTKRSSTTLRSSKSITDTDKKDSEQVEKCLRKCKSKFNSTDSKDESDVKRDSNSSASTKKSTSSRAKESIKDTNTKNKYEMEKCGQECKLKFGSKDSKYASKTANKESKSSASASSSKIITDADMKETEKESASSKTKKNKEDSNTEDTSFEDMNTKDKKQMEKCMLTCRLKLGSKEIEVEENTSSENLSIKDKKEMECKLKMSTKDSKYASEDEVKPLRPSKSIKGTDTKEIEKAAPSPSKTREVMENASVEDMIKKYKKEIEQCIRECKLKFGSKGSNHESKSDVKKFSKPSSTSSRSSKSIKDADTRGSPLKERFPNSSKTRKSLEDKNSEDTSIEDMNKKYKKEMKKCVRECKLKFGSKDSKNTSGSDVVKTDSKSSNLTKRSSISSRSKKSTDDRDEKDKEMEKCIPECKLKFATPFEKMLEKLKEPSKVKNEKEDSTVGTKKKAVSGVNKNIKGEKEETEKENPEGEKVKKENELKSDDTEEFYDALELERLSEEEAKALAAKDSAVPICKADQITEDTAIKTEKSNACGKETTAFVADFCANIKKVTEREKDCPAVIALKPKIDQLCMQYLARDKRKSSENSPSVIEIKEKVDQILIEDTDESAVFGKETAALVEHFCKVIKRAIEREKACPAVIALKPKIEQFCVGVTANNKQGKKNKSCIEEKVDNSNVCGKKAKSLEGNFCENMKRITEMEKACPAVIALKPRIEKFCADLAIKDKPVLETTKSEKDEVTIEENEESSHGDGNVCGNETTALVTNFCKSTKNAIEREKNCSAVIALKTKINKFCIDANDEPDFDSTFTPKASSTIVEEKDDKNSDNEECARSLSFPPTFTGCVCMKERYDRMVSLMTKRCYETSSQDVSYYRQSIICKRSNDRLERTEIERGGDGSSFDVSSLPPPPEYDKSRIFKK